MWKIAWQNLYHEKVRFVTALTGLVFAIVLIAVQASIFLSAVRSSSRLAREVDCDLWIIPYSASNADFSAPMPSRRRYQALGVPGVAKTGRMIVGFSFLRFPSGRQEPVIVVGTDTDDQWLPIDPDLLRVKTSQGRAVVFNRQEQLRFGENDLPLPVHARGEMNGHRVFVAGYADNMSSFAITPYAFTSYEAALDFTRIDEDKTVFVMAKCYPGADIEATRAELAARIPDVEVLTKDEFATRCWTYWIMGTGMGMSLMLMAVLALVVGITVVSQTLVTGVHAKIREYGVLKAMGFSNGFVAGVIVSQGFIVALLGYVLGCAVSVCIAHFMGGGSAAVQIDMKPITLISLLPITLIICAIASMAAAWRVFRLAPAEVFR